MQRRNVEKMQGTFSKGKLHWHLKQKRRCAVTFEKCQTGLLGSMKTKKINLGTLINNAKNLVIAMDENTYKQKIFGRRVYKWNFFEK